jgi:hypothetical protein
MWVIEDGDHTVSIFSSILYLTRFSVKLGNWAEFMMRLSRKTPKPV